MGEKRQEEEKRLIEFGAMDLPGATPGKKIYLLTIIGEIEGHECLPASTKTTKYEHVLPLLAKIENSKEYEGVLILLNSVGGDVECGLAIAEMISSMSKVTVSLVLGGSHSIALPLAVATDYSYIVPTGTMVIHPVRMNGMFIGAPQTYEYFQKMQDRIVGFITDHSKITKARLQELMMATTDLTKDIGSIVVGEQAVNEKIIDEIGGIHDAVQKLKEIVVELSQKR